MELELKPERELKLPLLFVEEPKETVQPSAKADLVKNVSQETVLDQTPLVVVSVLIKEPLDTEL